MISILFAFCIGSVSDGDVDPTDTSEVEIGLRLIEPGGDVQEETQWDDFFSAGFGLSVRMSHRWPTSSERLSFGLYAMFSLDEFQGSSFSSSDGSTTVKFEPEDLLVARLTAGLSARQKLSQVFLIEEYVGVGLAHYGSADMEISSGASSAEVDGIEGSSDWTFEVGIKLRAQVGAGIEFALGPSYEITGDPEVGDDIPAANAEAQENIVLNMSIALRF